LVRMAVVVTCWVWATSGQPFYATQSSGPYAGYLSMGVAFLMYRGADTSRQKSQHHNNLAFLQPHADYAWPGMQVHQHIHATCRSIRWCMSVTPYTYQPLQHWPPGFGESSWCHPFIKQLQTSQVTCIDADLHVLACDVCCTSVASSPSNGCVEHDNSKCASSMGYEVRYQQKPYECIIFYKYTIFFN